MSEIHAGRKEAGKSSERQEDRISLEDSGLDVQYLESVFETLPFELTFIDRNDTVRYFNRFGKRIFHRPKSVIGKKVQQCHPGKSIHKVNEILDAFRSGKLDVAEFWIRFRGRFAYIRYFPVRSRNGEYLGTMEVTQDITDIRRLKGEKRLL